MVEQKKVFSTVHVEVYFVAENKDLKLVETDLFYTNLWSTANMWNI